MTSKHLLNLLLKSRGRICGLITELRSAEFISAVPSIFCLTWFISSLYSRTWHKNLSTGREEGLT